MRTIGVVTGGRADYGIYLPLLKRIQKDPDLGLYLIVTGTHLSPEFGWTSKNIIADGFEINERIEMLLSSDTPEGITKSMGLATIGYAQAFTRFRPDLLVVLGDRFEMHAAALAALPFNIPVAHIHGGEVTQGAIDDAFRHSITKLSHIHFVGTKTYARRVIQMGEEPERVYVSGAPSLDNLEDIDLLNRNDLADKFGLDLDETPFLLVTYHPVTLEYEQTEWQTNELLAALETCGEKLVFTMPNADTFGRIIRRKIEEFVVRRPLSQAVESLGTQGYFSLMKMSKAMVGNSSSGIVEAPSFELPVVNIGTRQFGRLRGINVIDVGYERSDVLRGIQKASSPEFRASLSGMRNPYGAGKASEKIIKILKTVQIDKKLITKRFYDLDETFFIENG
ncbi:MAG: UDP-N-acetylglucosamine 2-epimerase [Anaerolineales bacterium]|nr:UDP-N-acetylglucosamine 2-epimerase [Anaerolineales bacterium]